MEYEYTVLQMKGVYVKTYLAQIKGCHPDWMFDRHFLRRTRIDSCGMQTYKFDIGGHGVFEQSVKYIDKDTQEIICQDRVWFVYYRKQIYEIERGEVLLSLFNLNLQYSNKTMIAQEIHA